MTRLRPILFAFAAALIAVPALAQNAMQNAASPSPAAAGVINVTINPQNDSKQSGTATITDVPGGIEVKVALTGAPDGASEQMHIHQGTCAKLNPAPYKALANVINGASTTKVSGISTADLLKGTYAINVHDQQNLAHYVACGDITKS